jgi:hypothetical protein
MDTNESVWADTGHREADGGHHGDVRRSFIHRKERVEISFQTVHISLSTPTVLRPVLKFPVMSDVLQYSTWSSAQDADVRAVTYATVELRSA